MDFSKYERLKNGIQVFKRKNKNPLEFAVKHIVTCLRDHSNDLVKIADFHNIFDTLASTCPEIVSNPQLGLPSQHVDRLENLVKQLITQGMVDKALELTTAPYPVPYRLPFLELQMQVYYHERNMEKFWKNVEVLESEKKVAYLETYYIWGTSLKDLGGERNLQKAINVFDKGMSEASREENQSLIERIKEEKKKVEKALKSPTEAAAPVHIAPQDVQNAPEAMQQAEEAKRLEIEEELLAGEEAAKAARILSESKGKAKKQKGRKGIQISEIKKAVEVEDESDGRVLEGKIQEKGSRSKLAVESRLQKRKFEVAFDVTIEDVDEKSSFGSTKTNTSEVRKSFIVAEPSHIINIQDLVDLCLTHENLLKIDQSLKPCDRSSPMLLTSEDVCSIHRFFECKWREISLQSNEDWWIAIKDMFWKVFRGVIRGLIHLFVKNRSCGDLVFNVFVTSKGEGRLLPSIEEVKPEQDLRGLVDVMQSVIKLPNPNESDLSFLPRHINHFFDLIKEVNWSIPPEFLINHPYFWNVSEKVDFIFKLRKLVKRNPRPLGTKLRELDLYYNWWDKLHSGLYYSVFTRAKAMNVQKYKVNVDIVRYFAGIYTHVNQSEYKVERNNKV